MTAQNRARRSRRCEQAESIVVRPDVQYPDRRSLRIAVVKLWNAIYYAKQPYLDDADGRFVEYHDRYGSAWLEAGDLTRPWSISIRPSAAVPRWRPSISNAAGSLSDNNVSTTRSATWIKRSDSTPNTLSPT